MKITFFNLNTWRFFITKSFGLLFLLISFKSFSQTTVNSLVELQTYLDDDNANIKLVPGTYSITASDVANDLYFIRINKDGMVTTKKVVK